ncbi:MAG: hypothetical protein VB959_17960 [Rhodospirillales bacterium]
MPVLKGCFSGTNLLNNNSVSAMAGAAADRLTTVRNTTKTHFEKQDNIFILFSVH